MVSINANLDLKTWKVLDTGRMNEDLADLCDQEFGVTFVARDTEFYNEAWRDKKTGKTYIRVVLPYEEVLRTDHIDLLAYQRLYEELDKVTWLDREKMKKKLMEIISGLKISGGVQ